MSVVSVRIPNETAKTLAEAGINAGDIAKEALEREARRVRVLAKLKRLERLRFKPVRPTLEILREIRDE
ncbi:MAG: hypothetical protein ABR562_08985 [Thermoplasmatota archaeon]|nr:hypothetical protein [Halobacteriales archaeon]